MPRGVESAAVKTNIGPLSQRPLRRLDCGGHLVRESASLVLHRPDQVDASLMPPVRPLVKLIRLPKCWQSRARICAIGKPSCAARALTVRRSPRSRLLSRSAKKNPAPAGGSCAPNGRVRVGVVTLVLGEIAIVSSFLVELGILYPIIGLCQGGRGDNIKVFHERLSRTVGNKRADGSIRAFIEALCARSEQGFAEASPYGMRTADALDPAEVDF